MPKLACPCGHVHDLSPIPDQGWLTVADAHYEELLAVEATITALSTQRPLAPAAAYTASDRRAGKLLGRLYACPDCGRLLWQRPGEKDFRTYAPEQDHG